MGTAVLVEGTAPLVGKLRHFLYRKLAVGRNVQLGREVHIGLGSRLWAPRSLTVGASSYVGRWCSIEVDGEIGRDVLIANCVGIIGRLDHDFRVVGTPIRHAPWVGDPNYASWAEQGEVSIGDDVWIGYGAIILSRARIGRGAIIAAGAVILGEVPPYEIWGGNPARRIGARFQAADIPRHERALARRWEEGA